MQRLTVRRGYPIVALALTDKYERMRRLKARRVGREVRLMSIRTRFAPSPTGFLHIGGVRTALFNWLFARHSGGRFILRIDDTDQQRHVENAVNKILDGFRWIGIDWDEGPEVGGSFGPYYQSERAEHYRRASARLLESGHVYRDYSTDAERAAEKTAAERDKRAYRFRRKELSDQPGGSIRGRGASLCASVSGSARPHAGAARPDQGGRRVLDR